jgi:creatinine amidohydrolase
VVKHLIEQMTSVEFKERMAEDPVILLPLGSQEVQGPCNPMGDYMLARDLATKVAERTCSLVAPTFPFGWSDSFRAVPGGIQVSPESFCGVLTDMIGAFVDHGLNRILVFNGHTGNHALVDRVVRDVRRARGVIVPFIDIWPMVPARVREQAHGPNWKMSIGHGVDPIGSVYAYLYPELRRPELADPVHDGKTLLGLKTTGLNSVAHGEVEVFVPMHITDHTDGTVNGDTSMSTAAAGKIFADYIVDTTCALVEHLKTAEVLARPS